eukprot:COSAG02_NODE_35603_length_466_cov_0.700272_1_plen_104_part_10
MASNHGSWLRFGTAETATNRDFVGREPRKNRNCEQARRVGSVVAYDRHGAKLYLERHTRVACCTNNALHAINISWLALASSQVLALHAFNSGISSVSFSFVGRQ